MACSSYDLTLESSDAEIKKDLYELMPIIGLLWSLTSNKRSWADEKTQTLPWLLMQNRVSSIDVIKSTDLLEVGVGVGVWLGFGSGVNSERGISMILPSFVEE